MGEYQTREIYAYGRYIQGQILNWQDGSPPEFLICHPLHKDYREPFLAHQAMGAWCRCDLRDALRGRDALRSEMDALRAENERLRECLRGTLLADAKHYFTPTEHDRDTCDRCGKDFREDAHLRSGEIKAELKKRAADAAAAALSRTDQGGSDG